ncbi:ATP-binding protein [Magnetococcus sp. PR-3]|uniref:ATP-binding protein n=1 Tax=Magnetococcus sp. PR-3 TaxID=3120355 RepID=UPI002FCE1005
MKRQQPFGGRSTTLYRARVSGVLTFVFMLLLTSLLVLQENTRYQEQLRVEVIDELSQIRGRLENEINLNFQITRGLWAFVAVKPNLSNKTFQAIARELLFQSDNIRNIGLAPDNVIRYIYPLKGNERALGLDYTKNRKQWPAVRKAIVDQQTVVAGPVQLIQGGQAFISRTPIFVTQADGRKGAYWGLASIVIDMDHLFTVTGLYHPGHTIRLALRGRDGQGAAGEVIHGDAALFNASSVYLSVQLPGGSWQLAAEPMLGWHQASPALIYLVASGFLIAVLAGGLVYQWLARLARYQHHLRQALRDAQVADQVKSDFFATMSHEIRTPMNVVIGMSDILLESIRAPEQRQQLQRLQHAGNALLELINNILDISRIEEKRLSLHLAPVDLNQLIKEVVGFFQLPYAEKGLQIRWKTKQDMAPYIQGDAGRIRQVLTNLLSNALKFTEKGVVEISLGMDPQHENQLQIVVRDSGIGLGPDQLATIFDKFTQGESGLTRRYGGSGLGLAISKQLVELMGGKIWVESTKEQGSQFFFTHPYKPVTLEAQSIMNPVPIEKAPFKAKIKLLLVEDSEDNQHLIMAFLKRTPYELSIAHDGSQAVEMVKNNRYDLILMDMQMPIMDGYQATAKIRAWEKDQGCRAMPIIALTAHALEGDRQKSLQVGCNDHLTKPIKKAHLLENLVRYLDGDTSAPNTDT